MRIAVTGKVGQVVSALVAAGPGLGAEIVTLGRPELDLAAPTGIEAMLDVIRPDILVSAAAYTAVDQAEKEPDLAMAINGVAPGLLAAAAARLDIPVIHLSTDYVFDGSKKTPYLEADDTGPTGAYGTSKLAGEHAVAAANPRHVILRTAWVYAAEGKNFVLTMLRLGETRPLLTVVSDQLGSPSYAPDIAGAVIAIARQAAIAPAGDARFGTFHMAGGGDTSWAGFAAAIFAGAARRGLPSAQVKPIRSEDYPTPAKRPANSRLDCSRLAETYGVALPFWGDALERCLDRIAAARNNTI